VALEGRMNKAYKKIQTILAQTKYSM